MTTTARITKAMKFDALAAIIEGKEVPYGLTSETLLEFIEKEKALLAKKNSGERKPTAKQIENEGFKGKVLEFLSLAGKPVTCTEIQKGIPEFVDFNNQKIASLANALVAEHKATKDVVKGRSVFSIA